MSSILSAPFSGGYVSRRDPYDFVEGELARMLGSYYKPGDSRPWKQLGRTAFGTVLANTRSKGLALCQFDDGSDKLVALAGTALYGATPGVTGTFASLATGLNAAATQLSAVQQDDRWYLCNGYDRNRVLLSDGTVRLDGLQSPSTAPTGTPAGGAGGVAYSNANTGGFTNPGLGSDANLTTFASGTLSAPGTVTHTWSYAANGAASRFISAGWWLSGAPFDRDSQEYTGSVGTGGRVNSGYEVTVLIQKSEDGGTVWTPLVNKVFRFPPSGIQSIFSTVTANSSLVKFRATLTYTSGTSPATLRIYENSIFAGSTTGNFSTTLGGFYYAVAWENQNAGMAGPPSGASALITMSAQNSVTVTRPGSPDTGATHWILYRTVDGATPTIGNFGYVDSIPIAETTYIDRFAIAATVQCLPIIPLMQIGDLFLPRDTPAPAFEFMWVHDASRIGLSRTQPRTIFYSEAGFPESYPEMYVVPAFALDEHDRLLCGTSLGRSSVVFAEGAVLAVDGLPRVVDGQFDAGQARPLKGHPGCVGRMAMTPFSVEGEARAAWVSPYGVYHTNGETCAPLSLDLAWETEVNQAYLSTAVLKWHPELLLLEFCFDSDGDGANDRTAFIHMSPDHRKSSGQPAWSQPTPKKISTLAGGLISGTYRRYSGHPSDGVVYLEESGDVDAATGAAVVQVIRTGKIGGDRVDKMLLKALLLHSDWGDGATGTLTVTCYREASGSSQVVYKVVRLNGQRGHETMVGRAGEKFDFQFEHSAAAAGAILGVEAEVERQGRSLSAGRWVTVSPA